MRMKLIAAVAVCSMSSVVNIVNLRAADTSLVDAVKSGDKAAVRALLKPSTVNAPLADGTTALHWAVQADDVATTELLIRAGADVKAVSRYGVTALALAAQNGNAAIVERLLKAGADRRRRPLQGRPCS